MLCGCAFVELHPMRPSRDPMAAPRVGASQVFPLVDPQSQLWKRLSCVPDVSLVGSCSDLLVRLGSWRGFVGNILRTGLGQYRRPSDTKGVSPFDTKERDTHQTQTSFLDSLEHEALGILCFCTYLYVWSICAWRVRGVSKQEIRK
jgi:hypothetical protein